MNKTYTCSICQTILECFQLDWFEGTKDWIYPGYGSKHDFTQFEIIICDNCLDDLKSKVKTKPYTWYTKD